MTNSSGSVHSVDWPANQKRDFSVYTLHELLLDDRPIEQDPERAHRIGFHSLILFTTGQTEHWIDGVKHQVGGNSLVHISPNQLHSFGEHKKSCEAIILSFRPSMVPRGVRLSFSGINKETLLSTIQYVWPSVTTLPASQTKTIRTLLEVLREYQPVGRANGYVPAARFLICSTVEFALQFAFDATNTTWKSRLDPIFLAFAEEIEASFAISRDAKWYAHQLDCAQSTLSRVCASATGKTPKQIVDHRVALEASRELTFTTTSAGSIGQALGFKESTNFVKFFRRQTGKTPDQFRVESRGTDN